MILLVSGIVLIAAAVSLLAVGVYGIVQMFRVDNFNVVGFVIGLGFGLFIPLLLILPALWATFVLVRHLKAKYAPVSTQTA